MKKLSMVVFFFLTIFMLWGCSKQSFDANEDTVYVKEKGTVIGAVVESFDKDYYDEDELNALIAEEVEEYNKEAGEDTLEIQKFEVEDKVAKVFIEYATGEDYAAFNKVEFFSGTIRQALEKEYEFNVEFFSAEDGKAVDKDTALSNEEYRVVVLEEPILVESDTDILYYSDNTDILSKTKVKVSEEAEGLAYIIYKK